MKEKYNWLPYAAIVLAHVYLITYIQYGNPLQYVYEEISRLEQYCEDEIQNVIRTIEDMM